MCPLPKDMKMKLRKKRIFKIVITVAIIFVGCLPLVHLLLHLNVFRLINIQVKKGQQRQVRLLCETDHQALLEACRELSRRVTTGDLERLGTIKFAWSLMQRYHGFLNIFLT